jgi:predicted esterase
VTHGTQDPILPLAGTRHQIDLLKAAGLTIEFHELAKVHTIAGEEEVDLIRNFVRAGYANPVGR